MRISQLKVENNQVLDGPIKTLSELIKDLDQILSGRKILEVGSSHIVIEEKLEDTRDLDYIKVYKIGEFMQFRVGGHILIGEITEVIVGNKTLKTRLDNVREI